jgi:hypothetical protein
MKRGRRNENSNSSNKKVLKQMNWKVTETKNGMKIRKRSRGNKKERRGTS